MRAWVLAGLLVLGAIGAGVVAAPANAGTTARCAASAKAGFARVQLFRDGDCRGPSVIVAKSGDANRPNFAAFANYDGSVAKVDNSRSSVAIDAGTCVRFFDAADYRGDASTNVCATKGVLFWNLARFDDRASSMHVCTTRDPAPCGGGSAPPPPQPPPAGGSFDPDPTGFGGATTAQRKANFIGKIAPIAKAVRAEFGVPVSFVIAQAAQESAWGDRTFGTARNFFGIKCPVGPAKIAIGCTKGDTHEEVNGKRTRVKADFRIYRSVLDSVRDQGSLLKRKYTRAMQVANNPEEFARQVQKGGYATDSSYAKSIITTMRVNHLYAYDR